MTIASLTWKSEDVINPNSNEYKITAIVLDIAVHRLFKPVGIKTDEIDKRFCLNCRFISIRNYRHGLILIIWGNFSFDDFVMKDMA
jgi:hypothetical protein